MISQCHCTGCRGTCLARPQYGRRWPLAVVADTTGLEPAEKMEGEKKNPFLELLDGTKGKRLHLEVE